MADFHLRTNGQTSIDLSLDSHWSSTPDGATGADISTATGGDILHLNEGGPNVTISASLDYFKSVDLGGVYIGKGCQLKTAAGSSLDLQVSGDLEYYGQSSRFSIINSTGDGIDRIISAPTAGVLTIANCPATKMPLILCPFARGRTIIGGDAKPTLVVVGGQVVEIQSGATAIPTLEIVGGFVTATGRAFATVRPSAGARLLTLGDVDISTKLEVSGAMVNARGTGTWASVDLRGGVITPAGGLDNGVTITALQLYGDNNSSKFYSSSNAGGSFTVSAETLYGTGSQQTDDKGTSGIGIAA